MIKHPHNEDRKFAELEFIRMGFDKESRWRISDINKDFELCNTYPRFLIVPSSFKDEDLESVAKFRYFRRIPTAVWRHNKNGCFIVRSSQPTVGWFGWFRSDLDEALVQSYVSNTIQQQSLSNGNNISVSEQPNDNNNYFGVKEDPKLHADCNEFSIKKVTSIPGAKADDAANGRPNTPIRDPRLSKSHDILNGDGKLKDRVNGESDRTLNQFDNAHETLKNETLTSYQASEDTGINETRDAECNSQTNGDISALANSLAIDGRISELKQSNQDPELPSTIIVNGSGQDLVQSDCTSDNSTQQLSNDSSDNPNQTSSSTETTTNNSTTAPSQPPQATTSKMLIIDARSYAAAMANRAKGGGCECSEYYQRCEVHFMNLANIHSIRKSYHAIRNVCEAYSEQSNK